MRHEHFTPGEDELFPYGDIDPRLIPEDQLIASAGGRPVLQAYISESRVHEETEGHSLATLIREGAAYRTSLTKRAYEELVLRATGGDAEAAADLVLASIPTIVKVVQKRDAEVRTLPADRLEDIFQNAMVAIYEAIDYFKSRPEESSYFNKIAYFRAWRAVSSGLAEGTYQVHLPLTEHDRLRRLQQQCNALEENAEISESKATFIMHLPLELQQLIEWGEQNPSIESLREQEGDETSVPEELIDYVTPEAVVVKEARQASIAQYVHQAVGDLSDPQRDSLRPRWFEEPQPTYDEISQRRSVAGEAVRKNEYTGMRRMKPFIKNQLRAAGVSLEDLLG